jgi:hypothetical protein
MRNKKPVNFRATITFVLPSRYKYIFGPKPFRRGKYRYIFDGDPNGSTHVNAHYSRNRKKPAPLAGKGRFLMEIVNGWKDKRRYRTTDRFFKEVELAVEWFKRQTNKEAVRIGKKGSYVRLGMGGDVGAKRNKKRHKTWHGVRKGVNWDHGKTSETVRKLGYTGASVARFLEMTTASVNRMARPEEITELDGWDR